jgi:hypothetical protein
MERRYVWIAALWGWLLALIPLWAASGGVIDLLEVMGFLVLAVVVVLPWLCSLAFAKVLRCRDWCAWGSVPLVWLLALILIANDAPMLARFHLSEPALRHYAGGEDLHPPHYTENTRYIGLFHVHKVWRHGRMVAFATDGKPFVTAGVMYAPEGLPSELPMEVEVLLFARYAHISGPWYRFEMDG